MHTYKLCGIYAKFMRKLIIIFFIAINLNVHGQEIIEPYQAACGEQLDVKNNSYYYLIPDQTAKFPGGNIELLKYFQKYLILPKGSCEYSTILFFIAVQSDGTAHFIRLVKPKDCINLETKIKNLINVMPKWKPAKCHGVTVEHRFYIPININLK